MVDWQVRFESGLSGQAEPALAEFAEVFDQGVRIALGQLPRVLRQVAQALRELVLRERAVSIIFRGPGEQLASDFLQPLLHVVVVGEIHRLELIDELEQAIERLLMDTRFGGPD